jgi:hypothetical protein
MRLDPTKVRIDKNIQVPPRTNFYGPITARMNVGDSVYLDNAMWANSLASSLKKLGFGAVTRREKTGVRVWKIKKD